MDRYESCYVVRDVGGVSAQCELHDNNQADTSAGEDN